MDQQATIDAWKIAYREQGAGTPVLFIHGGFGGAQGHLVPRRWSPIGQALGESARLIEYSRRNTGQSEMRDASYTQDDLAAEAAGLLDHLGIEQAVIVGDSMGGTIAQSFALAHPERVHALALLETSAHMSDAPFYGPLRDLIDMAENGGPLKVFERRRHTIYNPGDPAIFAALPDEARAAQESSLAEYTERLAETDEGVIRQVALGELCNWRAHQHYDTRERLSELARHTTLVLHGDADTLVPTEHGHELAEAIPGAELALIPGAGHGVLFWPAAREALRAWVAERGTRN